MKAWRIRASIGLALAATVAVPASASAVDYPASAGTTGPIPDGSPAAPLEVLFGVSGWSGSVENISVSITAKHTWVGDLTVSLAGPPGDTLIFGRPGVPATTFGSSADLDGTYTFSDAAPEAPSFEAATTPSLVPPGTYRAASAIGENTLMNPILAGSSPNGVWRLRIADQVVGDTGEVTGAVLHITGPPAPPPPPADTDPPETTITKRPKDRSTRNKVRYKFISDEAGSTFECKIDKKPFKPCTSPKKFKVKKGKHKFLVRATDQAGNTDPSAAKDKFKIVR